MDVVEYAVSGMHRVQPSIAVAGDEVCFDAIDLLVRDSTGAVAVVGFRTRDYVLADRHGPVTDWDGYRPLPITLDMAQVRHWDFNSILWVGPSPWPCLVWSNAEAFSERGIRTVFDSDRAHRILAGPGGRGLPTPTDLAVTVADDVRWVRMA